MSEIQTRRVLPTRRSWRWRHALCGCYTADGGYLPQVKVDAHTKIIQYASQTVFTQTYVNPSQDKQLEEIKYVFPLFDGVSVVAFKCTVGDRVISAVVKDREEANKEYSKAQSEGRTAIRLRQQRGASDVFETSIGNMPPGERAVVEITCLWELKHDAEIDGIRFTIPTHIAPRYGEHASLEKQTSDIVEEGLSVTIDIEMPGDLAIKSIQSSSHPISVSIGGGAEPPQYPLEKASITLSQSSTALDKDFVIEAITSQHIQPVALLETHPTIPNQCAVMATLVPKFKLPPERPEIVFVCDRSGSMGGEKIENLVAALNIFLKSLPVGVKFNICSFGSHHSFLWPKSRSYSQETLEEAVQHVSTFDADFGGTVIDAPVKATFDQRHADMNLEVFLLTDGQIRSQEKFIAMVNESVAESRSAIRVFTLGIGSGASTGLMEGAARAGNGFAQMVQNSEKMSKKVIRMLKAAITPHILNYSLEIKYEEPEPEPEPELEDEEDFEIVENVIDSPSVQTLAENEPRAKETEVQQPISLFDPSFEDNEDCSTADELGKFEAKYDHLPSISAPSYLQTPSQIPQLYSFNRTTVYVMLSDSNPKREPKSVVLKGTSYHGPLELEIPVVKVESGSFMIHQFAARNEVRELEEGRGWLTTAKDSSGRLLKDEFQGRFSAMVEREAVRLGVQFQVASKWTSFVGAEECKNGPADQQRRRVRESRDLNHQAMVPCNRDRPALSQVTQTRPREGHRTMMRSSPLCTAPASRPVAAEKKIETAAKVKYDADFLLKLRDASPGKPISGFDQIFKDSTSGQSASGGQRSASRVGGFPMGAFGIPPTSPHARFGASQPVSPHAQAMALTAGPMKPSGGRGPFAQFEAPKPVVRKPYVVDPSDKLQAIVALQTFTGSWVWSDKLEQVLGATCVAASGLELPDAITNHANKGEVLATCCAMLFIKKRLKEDVEIWEMLMEKAEGWLESQVGVHVGELVTVVSSLF